MDETTSCNCCEPRAAAVALARWCLGMLFLFFGIGKLMMGVGQFVGMMSQPFEKTWLPLRLVQVFGHILPFAELILGALLLLGLFRNVALFCTGILLLVLTFGQVVLGAPQVVFFNTSYLFMTAAVLFLTNWDKWVLFPRCASRLQDAPPRQASAS